MSTQADKKEHGDRTLRVVQSDPKSPPVPKKPCSCCKAMFQPTLKRRMLCAYCYRSGDKRREVIGFI